MELLIELIGYFKARKKFIMIPLFLLLILFAVLIVLTEGSVLSPFIYTLF